MRFPVTSASLNAMEASRPPAVVRAAKDWRFYESTIVEMDQNKGALLKEYKDSEVWRDHYRTWKDACVPLNISSSQADRLIKEDSEINAPCVNDSDKDKSDTLKKVAKLPVPEKVQTKEVDAPQEPPKNADEWEEKEHFTAKVVQRQTDDLNRVIPKLGEELMERAESDLKPYLSAASRLQALFQSLQKTKHDQLYAHLDGHLQLCSEHAHELFRLLSYCQPERVCPGCDGDGKKCDVCMGTGMVSKYRWTHYILKGTDPKLADKARKIMDHASS